MAATQLGLINTASPGRTIEVSDTGGITHVVPRTMKTSAALDPATHPALGAVLQILGNTLTLRGYSISFQEGDIAEVQYRYGSAIENSNPSAPIYSPGYPGNTGTPVTEFYELESTLESVSILRHPRYQNLASTDLQVLGMMIQLGPLDADNTARRESLSSGLAEECADKIESGTISYLAPKYVWRYRRLGGSWSNPYPLGKKSNPPGPAPSLANANWLFMGASANGWVGGAFESTYIWESSPAGDVWDSDLYS
jgi:hypothetical protein